MFKWFQGCRELSSLYAILQVKLVITAVIAMLLYTALGFLSLQ